MTLTGVKDIDLEIMNNLDDRSLLTLCKVSNRYIHELCNNEAFWRNRFIKIFGQKAGKYKPEDRTWKRHYLTVIMYLDELNRELEDPFEFFTWIDGQIGREDFYTEVNKTIKKQDEKHQIGYWLFNLGKNKITILYPIDRYEELDLTERKYTTDTYFTPAEVIKHISDFYNETITPEELIEQQEADNPYAEDFTVQDAENGVIRRKHLMNMFFEGLTGTGYEDKYMVMLGS